VWDPASLIRHLVQGNAPLAGLGERCGSAICHVGLVDFPAGLPLDESIPVEAGNHTYFDYRRNRARRSRSHPKSPGSLVIFVNVSIVGRDLPVRLLVVRSIVGEGVAP
jgi:hypothetical protein